MLKEKIIKLLNSRVYYLFNFAISFLIVFSSLICNNFSLAFIGIIIFWLFICVYCFGNLEKRIFLLIFNLMIFVFIIDRPLIDVINGNLWHFSNMVLLKSFLSIYISILYLLVGNVFYEKLLCNEKEIRNNNINNYLQKIAFVILIITFIFSAYKEIYTFIKMHNLDYALIYTAKAPNFNIVIRIMDTLFPYAVFAYLALIPNKNNSIMAMLLFLIVGVPSFLLGSRNVIILRLLLCISYVIIRYFLNKEEKWITKKIMIIAIIIVPLLIAFLGAYNYIRDNNKVKSYSIINLSLDFFYKQGTTFDTVCQGFEYEDKLKNNFNVTSYTFGDLIDYGLHNTISRKIFKTEDLGTGNNLNMLKYGNSMAHNLSYSVLGKASYLSGHGRGTSYLIETYMDFNFYGVAIYSLVIGIFLSSIINIFKRNKFLVNLIILTMIFQIFLLPRYSATGFITFLITPQFWIIPIMLYVSELLRKRRVVNNEK